MKILIADDESLIRMGLRSMLRELGHEVIMAKDGKEALLLGAKEEPEMAVLDINMPHVNGLQVARVLYKHRPIPLLFLTAYSDLNLIEQATDLPIMGYLIKPIQSAELHAAMTVALKRFQEKQNESTLRERAEERLENRIFVDRAKGKLIDRGMSEEEAYHHLQKMARDQRLSLRDVANQLLDEEKNQPN